MATNGNRRGTGEEDATPPKVSGSRDRHTALVVAVEGNIGSGKSTFLKFCQTRSSVSVHPEPVEKWRNVNGENLLANMYVNPTKWAMTFQLYAGMTILDNYKSNTWKDMKMIERSLLSSRYVFLEEMKQSGHLEPAMGKVLETWYDRAFEDYQAMPNAIVYLRTSPTTAHDRLLSRARPEEANIPIDYLERIHTLHENWITKLHDANQMFDDPNIALHVMDADLPIDQMYLQYESCMEYLHFLNL